MGYRRAAGPVVWRLPILRRLAGSLRLTIAGASVLSIVLACGTSAPAAIAPRATEPIGEVALVAPSQIPGTFLWRQRVTVAFGEEPYVSEVVLEKSAEQLVLVLLSPAMTPLFTVRQTDAGVEVTSKSTSELPLQPAVMLEQVHLALFTGLFGRSASADKAKGEPSAGRYHVGPLLLEDALERGGIRTRQVWHKGARTLRVTYTPPYLPGTPPKRIELRPSGNAYHVVIEML